MVVFGILSCFGIGAAIVDHRASERDRTATVEAEKTLQKKVDELRESSLKLEIAQSEAARVQSLNTELQQRLLTVSANLTDLARQNIYTVTGGDSFCYIACGGLETSNGSRAMVIQQGRYPLYDVSVRIVDTATWPATAKQYTIDNIDALLRQTKIGDIPVSAGALLPEVVPFSDSQHQNFNIFFSALNGEWWELLRLRKVNGRWLEAIRVKRRQGRVERTLFERVDKGYPTVAGHADWSE